MLTPGSVFARVLYGGLFVVVVPIGLVLWARALEPVVALTVVHSLWAGTLLVAAGVVLGQTSLEKARQSEALAQTEV